MTEHYVYSFDCINCYDWYGDTSLTLDGKLLCPNCEQEEDKDASCVMKIAVLFEPLPYTPQLLGTDK